MTELDYIMMLAAGLALLIFILWYAGLQELATALRRASLVWIAAACIFKLFDLVIRGARWRSLLLPINSSTKFSSTFSGVAVCQFMSTLIP